MEEEKKTKRVVRTYGKWKPGQVLDNGKGRKKPGTKKGVQDLSKKEFEERVSLILEYMEGGTPKVTHRWNKAKGVKPNVPLTVEQACKEAGTTNQTFYTYMGKYPSIKQKYKEILTIRRKIMQVKAEDVLEEAVSGNMKDLSAKDRVETAKFVAKQTIKEYNPKTEIETKSIGINLNKSSDDIMADLESILGLKNT